MRYEYIFLILPLILVSGCCPETCNDSKICTQDSCSILTGFKCQNVDIIPCIGNSICEPGEYPSQDCPDCDDDYPCTEDSFNYNKMDCNHIIINPCDGNGKCEPGEEGVSKDCS
ncbi:hypothetical protein K9M79_08465 [Candidatus Woesearchaeota archaeon]|nr:hypothetical protein [Candidatus Woesearchaeota archaeon]